jgi:hypothetical protein
MNAIKDLLDESIAQQVKDLEELYHAALNYNNCSCASSNNPIKENNG